jgi:hypothetical protein
MSLAKPKASTKEAVKEKEVETVEETRGSDETSLAEVSRQTTAMAAAPVQSGSLEAQLAEEGFEGMSVGYHSFVTIKLPSDGIFATGDDEQVGTEIKVVLLQSKRKYVYNRDDDDDAVLFSYDQVTTTSGESLSDALDEWKNEGAKVTEKHYLDMQADVLDGELEGETVMLSIAPSSVQKLTGYMGKLRRKGLNPKETVTQLYVMDKVKTKGGKQFYPWGFKLGE